MGGTDDRARAVPGERISLPDGSARRFRQPSRSAPCVRAVPTAARRRARDLPLSGDRVDLPRVARGANRRPDRRDLRTSGATACGSGRCGSGARVGPGGRARPALPKESRSRTSGTLRVGPASGRLARGGRGARCGGRRRRRRLGPRRRPRRRRRVARRAGRPRLGRLRRSRLEPAGGRYPARRELRRLSPHARAPSG